MSKKLLSEMQVRRFARLANLSPINEMDYKRDEKEKVDEMNDETEYPKRDDEETMEEGAYMKRDEDEQMEEAEEPEMDMPEEEPELAGLEGEEMELTDEEAQAIIDLGKKLEAAMGEGGMEEPEMEMDAPEPEMDMPEEPEEEIMEALSGINYIPEKKEIVEEVARRVAKRLLKAKRAERNLQEALGKSK